MGRQKLTLISSSKQQKGQLPPPPPGPPPPPHPPSMHSNFDRKLFKNQQQANKYNKCKFALTLTHKLGMEAKRLKEIAESRTTLQPRQQSIQFDKLLGKTKIIDTKEQSSNKTNFYCQLCDCSMHDSISYVQHLNGKFHNRKKGMSMKVQRVGIQKIRSKLYNLTQTKELDKDIEKEQNVKQMGLIYALKKGYKEIQRQQEEARNAVEIDSQTGLKVQLQIQESREKDIKQAQQSNIQKKQQENDDQADLSESQDQQMEELMGFGFKNFGKTNKK